MKHRLGYFRKVILKHSLATGAVSLLGPMGLGAAEALSLADALARAEQSNPGLAALHERALAASYRVTAARALPDPRIQATVFGESVHTRTGPQRAIFSLQQTVPWWGKRERRGKLAASAGEALEFANENARLNLRSSVSKIYYEAAYLHHAIASTDAHRDLIEDLRAIVEERVRGGASVNALLRLEVEWERNRDRLARLQQELQVQREHLAAWLNIDASEMGPLAPDSIVSPTSVSTETPEQLEARLWKMNPELAALRAETGGATESIQLAELDRRPDVTFGLNYITVDGRDSTQADSGRNPWSVSIALNLPIWQSRTRSAIAAAQSLRRSAEQQEKQRRLQLRAELRATLARYRDAGDRVMRYQERLIPLAEQALENTHTGYEGGTLTILDLIDSERALLDLQLSRWRAQTDLKQAQASIEALIGGSIDGRMNQETVR